MEAINIVTGNRPVTSNSITYSISLINNFWKETQPWHYPKKWDLSYLNKEFHGPVFERPVFISHNADYKMWEKNCPASNDIGQASLYGTYSKCKLLKDIDKNIPEAILESIVGKSYVAAEYDGLGEKNFVHQSNEVIKNGLTLDSDHTLISSFFRIMPSPCWFSGFHDFEPVSAEGMWYESFKLPVYPHTTRWATGSEYIDQFTRNITITPGNITRFDVDTVPRKVFRNKDRNDVPPVAYITFKRIKKGLVQKLKNRLNKNFPINEGTVVFAIVACSILGFIVLFGLGRFLSLREGARGYTRVR